MIKTMQARRLLAIFALCAVVGASACVSGAKTSRTGSPPVAVADDFDDHTVLRLEDADSIAALAASEHGTHDIKFIIDKFSSPNSRRTRFMDARFYRFHDEWYWFSLLNGHSVSGQKTEHTPPLRFRSTDEATLWAQEQEKLPFGLSFADERLYSTSFYEEALHQKPRKFGLGRIFWFQDPSAPPRSWYFELEYEDDLDAQVLSVFFQTLQRDLPSEVAKGLRWVARSPHQHRLVQQMREAEHPLAPLVLLAKELDIPQKKAVYNPGITAGILRWVELEELDGLSSNSHDILILPQPPDYLPAAAGIVTLSPQTPLAHVNLLARNRGIPNAYFAHADKDWNLMQLARSEMPVVLLAEGDQVVIRSLARDVYQKWLARVSPPLQEPVPLEVSRLHYVSELSAEKFHRVDSARLTLGGKSAGFLALLAGGATVPPEVLAISVRAFHEHMESFRPILGEMLATPAFRSSEPLRYLVLEGKNAFLKRYPSEKDRAFAEKTAREYVERGDALGRLIALGGLGAAIRAKPVATEALQVIESELRKKFGSYLPVQGLRFRSSSNVEDIEGFSGAGLYTSSTGFLDAKDTGEEHRSTIEQAIKRTWSSYWGWEAFEEREREGVGHINGEMGVLVHARFDDQFEVANGVFTLTENEGASPEQNESLWEMNVNVLGGAESVTNPESQTAPEVIRIWNTDGSTVYRQYGKSQPSLIGQVIEQRSIAPAMGAPQSGKELIPPTKAKLLSDAQLSALFQEAIAVARSWLAQENEGLKWGQKRRGLTLDFEFRLMSAQWPQQKTAHNDRTRMILKQVRSLEPAPRLGLEEFAAAPIPRELFVRAVRIEEVRCRSEGGESVEDEDGFSIQALLVFTDPHSQPNFGFSKIPYLASLELKYGSGEPESSWTTRTPTVPFEQLGILSGTREKRGTLRWDGSTIHAVTHDGEAVEGKGKCWARALFDDPDHLLREALATSL